MRRMVWLVVAVWCCACAREDPRIKPLETKVSQLEAAQKLLELRLDLTETNLAAQTRPKSALFTPSDKGYSAIYTDVGVFLVSLDNIQPYANGYKATFQFGNPSAMNFDGAEIELRWGPSRPSDGFQTVKYSDWLGKFQTKKHSINRRLVPGSWNRVDVVIAPATAESIGQIEITSISTSKLSLLTR